MSLYRFDWKVFATDDLLDRLLVAAGVVPAIDARDALRPGVARVLSAVGGPPVSPRAVPASERGPIGAELLADALAAVLAPVRARSIPGVAFDRDGAFAKVTATDRIALNSATPADIERIPGIGPALAGRIVAERRRAPFRGLQDLAVRVDGIGATLVERIRAQVSFALPSALGSVPGPADLESDFARLARVQAGSDPLVRAAAVLDAVLAAIRTRPTPAPARLFAELEAPDPETLQADEVRVLASTAYYGELARMLGGAQARIDVAMFHIAMPGTDHPTRRLLNALAAARDRGVTVRVLVDRDRASDPYHSTVINADAVAWLRDQAIAVRQDAAETLLHSKFVVIDSDLTIIGSHNWTAGSYFQFDDLSLVLRGTAVARAQRARFVELWTRAA